MILMYYVGNIPCVETDIRHFGIPGMKWGQRRFQNTDGTYTPQGLARYFGGVGEAIQKKSSLLRGSKEVYGASRTSSNAAGTTRKFLSKAKSGAGGPNNYGQLGFEKGFGNLQKARNSNGKSMSLRTVQTAVGDKIRSAGDRIRGMMPQNMMNGQKSRMDNRAFGGQIRMTNDHNNKPSGYSFLGLAKSRKGEHGKFFDTDMRNHGKSGIPEASQNWRDMMSDRSSGKNLASNGKSAFNSFKQKASVAVNNIVSNPRNMKIAVGVLAGTAAVGVGIAVARRIAKKNAAKKSKKE